MSALAYLQTHGLEVEPLPDGKLSIGPVANITPDIRDWIRAHKADVLAELAREADEDDRELPRAEAEQQAAHRAFEYRLAGIDQWLMLIGQSDGDIDIAKRWLNERYGDRVTDVRRYRPELSDSHTTEGLR